MPPIRRYLRITQYSVLECRIYLDNPADAHRWLLNERMPVLPRVIEAVRPLVLPKLREENAKAKSGKGGKRKGWKDVVVQGIAFAHGHALVPQRSELTYIPDDFEVTVFLTEISSRHAILHKEKRAKTEKPRLGTSHPRLTGEGTRDVPVQIEATADPVIVREESQEEKTMNFAGIPAADEEQTRTSASAEDATLFVSDASEHESNDETPRMRKTLQRHDKSPSDVDPPTDDKKKLGMNTSYDGFSIYGRILCLVVKRRGNVKGKDPARGVGQAMMEEWIASTQLAEEQMMD
ncbi:MAG: hypothetical protein Q9226_006566 [Calogaya cf. arnoldii]